MGFYPVEVLVNDAKRHGVAVLPVDINTSTYKTTTEWVGRPGWASRDGGDDGRPTSHSPVDAGIERATATRFARRLRDAVGARARSCGRAESAAGWGVRLGLGLVKGIGEEHEELLDRGAGARAVRLARRRRRADGAAARRRSSG